MKIVRPILVLQLVAAFWALLELMVPDIGGRCLALWVTLAAAWLAIGAAIRFVPGEPIARWLRDHLPPEKAGYSASRRVFTVSLGVIFFIAFWSWGSQVRGLVGEHGLLPVSEQLASARAAGASWWQVPSLSWVAGGDAALIAQCWIGGLLAIALAAGFCPGACALLCWALYLSLVSVGESFANFQWDALLLETALPAALWLPWRLRPDWGSETAAQRIGRWLLWWLFIRMMIESGVVKLTWDDRNWLNFSALDYHFETQPLPLWTAWYAHQLPSGMLWTACWVTCFIEIATPALLLAPARWLFLRRAAVVAQVALQAAILGTGNYTFFNWLTIALSLTFLDDSFLFLRRLRKPPPESTPRARWPLVPAAVLAVCSVVFTFDGFAGAFGGARAVHAPSPSWILPLRSFNAYGLFRTMTTSRPEIIIEGSDDGINWREYEFPHKAGDIYRHPALVAPHQPRLDWQMWFAALAPREYGYFLERLIRRVLEAEPHVLALLETNPFPSHPPRYVRLSYYDYHFTRLADETAAWWKRELRGSTEPFTIESFTKPQPGR